MKKFVKLSVVFFVCSTLYGQQIPVQSDHGVYSYLYRQSIIGILPQWLQSKLPLTLDQVLNLLTQVTDTSDIGNSNRTLAERLIIQFLVPVKSRTNLPFSKSNKINHLLYYGSADIEPHLSALKHEKPSLWYWNKKFIFALSKKNEKYFQYKSILTKEIK